MTLCSVLGVSTFAGGILGVELTRFWSDVRGRAWIEDELTPRQHRSRDNPVAGRRDVCQWRSVRLTEEYVPHADRLHYAQWFAFLVAQREELAIERKFNDGRVRLSHTATGYGEKWLDSKTDTYFNSAKSTLDAFAALIADARAGRQIKG